MPARGNDLAVELACSQKRSGARTGIVDSVDAPIHLEQPRRDANVRPLHSIPVILLPVDRAAVEPDAAARSELSPRRSASAPLVPGRLAREPHRQDQRTAAP